MQIIAEERNYRFCAESEDQLARCLGAVKSLLARRKGTVAGTAGTGTGTAPATAASAAAGGGIGQNTVVN